MREIVYLSEGKLSQFVPERRRLLPRTGTLRVTTPVGGFDVDAPATEGEQSLARHLRQVDKHMELVSRWYGEPDLRPGQWVQFEVPLRSVTPGGVYQGLVLFVDQPRSADPAGEEGADCRLLMHGSARHLRGVSPATVDVLEAEDGTGGFSIGPNFVTRAGQVVRALSAQNDAPDAPDEAGPEGGPTGGLNSRGVRDLLKALDEQNGDLDMSVLMTGYARVSALLPETGDEPRCLVASPLTVQILPE
ncbi:SAVMC3_10250 family protein [Streptomyces sp. Da 82-17]|uniref:SAVMC3_10250 family protein n=1 Tax=Streptomyces sp. Da 82-17 TaxID=3377116 RepID=UPI0038D425C8